ncbi:pyridoxamine 5'-phosphate oxidase family protein [Dinoroseobacter sp. S375]|uniref:pyridoxamine 5'-phosphate oxidase family protein n=1 Tax=Dinoroseobacter sp. S375 TaxID=3415136 RepID=UPI003C7990F2
MSNWYTELDSTLDQVWQLLGRAVRDPKSPLRTPVMATVGADGHPDARVVVLRDAARSAGALEVHTDRRSKKVKDLESCPLVTFCAWLPKADLQVRIKTIATVASGPDVLSLWQSMSEAARRVYGGVPAPGMLLAHPSEFGIRPDPADLARLRCDITEIETLHLGRELHRRARFRRDEDWVGSWRAP